MPAYRPERIAATPPVRPAYTVGRRLGMCSLPSLLHAHLERNSSILGQLVRIYQYIADRLV